MAPKSTPEPWSGASTRWGSRRVRIGSGPAGKAVAAGVLKSFRALRPRRPNDALTVTMAFRGTDVCWIEVHARGVSAYVPGSMCLLDLVMLVNNADVGPSKYAYEAPGSPHTVTSVPYDKEHVPTDP